MRTLSLVFLPSLFILFASFSSKPTKKLFTPPGTVRVDDTLYFDDSEISNVSWREFELWNKKTYGQASEEYKRSLPDTTVWRQDLAYNEPYVDYYYRHPAYSNYPLVGITYEQAVEFCKWRTERVKDIMEAGGYKNQLLPKSFYYRLPTKEEWENAAKVGYDEKTLKSLNSKKWKGVQPYNMIAERTEIDTTYPTNKYNPNADITAPVYTFWPNQLKLYNLFGNVSEMVQEEGISKGGGWRDKKKEVAVEKDYPYDGASAWLGFRCVCVVEW